MKVTVYWVFRLGLAVFALGFVVVAFFSSGFLALSAITTAAILIAVNIAISIVARRRAGKGR